MTDVITKAMECNLLNKESSAYITVQIWDIKFSCTLQYNDSLSAQQHAVAAANTWLHTANETYKLRTLHEFGLESQMQNTATELFKAAGLNATAKDNIVKPVDLGLPTHEWGQTRSRDAYHWLCMQPTNASHAQRCLRASAADADVDTEHFLNTFVDNTMSGISISMCVPSHKVMAILCVTS